jgi:hypothetical protein
MARTTRSSANADQPLAKPLAAASRKRKRTSVAAEDSQPTNKQSRIDEEPTDPDSQDIEHPSSYVGDAPLDPTTASKILDILELIDTQGLLDRVFPLQTINPSSPISYSFRNLLSDSSQHSLATLRSAVHHLFPLSSQPRSKRSAPATQQLQFCNLALSLLDQASRSATRSIPDLASLFAPEESTEEPSDDVSRPSSSTSDVSQPRKLRYALVQHLSSTDWWTSLNSELALADAYKLTELSTANANLVAVLPTPVASSNASSSAVPTLGSYNTASVVSSYPLPVGRKVSVGTFLDYGVYASFAPTFEQEGRIVGRNQIAEVIWSQAEKRRQRGRRGRIQVAPAVDDITMADEPLAPAEIPVQNSVTGDMDIDLEETLGELLPPEEMAEIKSTLESEALEKAVEELLERNKRALQRLQELQYIRLIQPGGEKSLPKEGSEEWDTAQSILESLSLLTSLRPHSSTDGSSIAPSPSVLHKLSRSLPSEQLPNWQGTLPPSNPTALRDDTTIKIKPFLPTTAALPPATPVVPTSTTPTYSGYPYTSGYSNYRPTGYAPYAKGTQTSAYGTTPYTASNYYQNYQSNYSSYAPWYNYSGAGSSGRATPHVGMQSPAPIASTVSYSSIPGAQAQQQRVLPVANTVASHPDASGSQQIAPTLPPYLRTTAQQMTNGATQGYQYGQSPILS